MTKLKTGSGAAEQTTLDAGANAGGDAAAQQVEADRLAAEQAKRAEAERLAAEQAAADLLAAQQARQALADSAAAEQAQQAEAARIAADQLAASRHGIVFAFVLRDSQANGRRVPCGAVIRTRRGHAEGLRDDGAADLNDAAVETALEAGAPRIDLIDDEPDAA